MNAVQLMNQSVSVKATNPSQKNVEESASTFETFLNGLVKENEAGKKPVSEETIVFTEDEKEIIQLLNLLFSQSEEMDGNFLGEIKELVSEKQQAFLQEVFPEQTLLHSKSDQKSISLDELFTSEEFKEVKTLLANVREVLMESFRELPIEEVATQLSSLDEPVEQAKAIEKIKESMHELLGKKEKFETVKPGDSTEISQSKEKEIHSLEAIFREFKTQLEQATEINDKVQKSDQLAADHSIQETIASKEEVQPVVGSVPFEEKISAMIPSEEMVKQVEESLQEGDGKKVSSIEDGVRFVTNSKPNPEISTQKTTQAQSVLFQETMTVEELVTTQEKLVVESVVQSGEKMSAKIQLTPEHLGKVAVEIEMIDERLTLKWTVENAETKQLLDQQFNQFKQDMAVQKLAVHSFSVDVQTGQNQDGSQSFQSQQEKELKIEGSDVEQVDEESKNTTDSIGANGVSLLI